MTRLVASKQFLKVTTAIDGDLKLEIVKMAEGEVLNVLSNREREVRCVWLICHATNMNSGERLLQHPRPAIGIVECHPTLLCPK